MSDYPSDHIVQLSKRESPSDYWDGYLAGLRAAAESIDRFIEIAQEIRRTANTLPNAQNRP